MIILWSPSSSIVLHHNQIPEQILHLDDDISGGHGASLVLPGVNFHHGSVPSPFQVKLDL